MRQSLMRRCLVPVMLWAVLLGADAALAAEGTAAGKSRSAFAMFFVSPDIFGQIMIIILIFGSMTVVSLSIQAWMSNRRKVLMPEPDVAEYTRMAEEKQYAAMVSKAATDPSLFGKVLHAALSNASQGYDAMERAIEETAEVLATERIRKLEYLNIMGAVGPMAGLFGTVYGMIVAFEAMVSAGGQPKPAELAAGVSTALVNTFWGLIVAIPAIVAAALARNFIEGLVVQIMVRCEELISRFRPAKVKKPAAAPEKAEKPERAVVGEKSVTRPKAAPVG